MIHLIYTSTASSPYSLLDINILLAECRLRNTFLGVTGILVYNVGSIMQILEGDDLAVQKLYAQIKIDKRHHNVLTVGEYKIEKRNYVKWSMAFKEITDKDWSSIESCLIYPTSANVYPTTNTTNTNLVSIIDSFINLSTEK